MRLNCIDRFQSRGRQLCKLPGAKESFNLWKEFNCHRIFFIKTWPPIPCFVHKCGCRDVMWKREVTWSIFPLKKQCVGILLMPKIDTTHKNYLTPEHSKETHSREMFYGTLIDISCWIRVLLLSSNMVVKTTFYLYLVKRSIVTLRCPVNVTTSAFQQFTWSLSAKFVFMVIWKC